jgi:hypothetical protein
MKQLKSNSETQHAIFIQLRNRLSVKQGDLLSQYQHEIREIPSEDTIAITRLKLIYRQKGLNI